MLLSNVKNPGHFAAELSKSADILWSVSRSACYFLDLTTWLGESGGVVFGWFCLAFDLRLLPNDKRRLKALPDVSALSPEEV